MKGQLCTKYFEPSNPFSSPSQKAKMTVRRGFCPVARNAQDGRDTGSIVVRTVVYPVVCQRLVRTQVVEVGTYDDIFIRSFSRDGSQYITHLQDAVDALFKDGDGVGMHLPPSPLLAITVLFQRGNAGFFQAGCQIAGSQS